MPSRTATPRNRIVFSAAVLVIGLSLVWYQRSHLPAGSAKKPFLSQAPSSEAGNKVRVGTVLPGGNHLRHPDENDQGRVVLRFLLSYA
jgi:hypothetical protein